MSVRSVILIPAAFSLPLLSLPTKACTLWLLCVSKPCYGPALSSSIRRLRPTCPGSSFPSRCTFSRAAAVPLSQALPPSSISTSPYPGLGSPEAPTPRSFHHRGFRSAISVFCQGTQTIPRCTNPERSSPHANADRRGCRTLNVLSSWVPQHRVSRYRAVLNGTCRQRVPNTQLRNGWACCTCHIFDQFHADTLFGSRTDLFEMLVMVSFLSWSLLLSAFFSTCVRRIRRGDQNE